jgi:hypothetical protein
MEEILFIERLPKEGNSSGVLFRLVEAATEDNTRQVINMLFVDILLFISAILRIFFCVKKKENVRWKR